MIGRSTIATAFVAISLSHSTRVLADEEPMPLPAETPPPADVEGPPRPPPDAPLPPEPPDEVTPRPTEAPVEPEPELVQPRFGAPGVVVLSGDTSFNFGFATYSGESEAKRAYVTFQPGFDVFVARNFSVGASISVAHTFARGYSQTGLYDYFYTSVAAGPRFGYAIPLGRWLSLYPRVNLSVAYTSSVSKGVSLDYVPTQLNGSSTAPYLFVFVPLLFHPTSSFFVGAGPSFYKDFGGKGGNADLDEQSTFNFRMIVGGYFGGTPVPHDRTTLPPLSREPKRYHFGEQGDLLLGADLTFGAGTSRYAQTKRTATSFLVSPAFDYFVGEHFSVGLGVGVGASKVAVDSTAGGGVTDTLSTSTTFAGNARLAVQASLTPRLSLYPRASFRVSYEDITARSVAGAPAEPRENTTLTAELFLPLVVHPVPHFYIGFGPFIARELSRYLNGTSADVHGTFVGASTMVGGWL